MAIGYFFENNRTQSVRLPDEARFSTEVKNVMVRVVGQDRILSPLNRAWDSFFQSDAAVTDDFMEEHSTQKQT